MSTIQKNESADESGSSLSSANTDIKLNTNTKIKKHDNMNAEQDNIEVVKKSRNKSWYSGRPFRRKEKFLHTKSEGDDKNDSDSDVKGTRTKKESDDLRRESTYMELYNGKKYKAINGWNIALELKCREIALECATYKWLHNKNALILGGKLAKTTLIAAIISSISGISVLIDYIVTNYFEDVIWINPVMKLILFLMNLVVAIILIVQKTYDFAQKIEDHRVTERQHNWLFYDIQSQLQKNTKDRTPGNDYFKWITQFLNNIADSSDIDDDVIKEFYQTFQDTKIPGLDTMNQLQINVDDEESSSSTKLAQKQSSTGNMSVQGSLQASDTVIDVEEPTKREIRVSTDGLKNAIRRSSILPEGKNKKAGDDYVRNFREQRNMNVLSLGSNTNMPQFVKDNQTRRMHNPDLMAYELKRMDTVIDETQ